MVQLNELTLIQFVLKVSPQTFVYTCVGMASTFFIHLPSHNLCTCHCLPVVAFPNSPLTSMMSHSVMLS